MEKSTSLYKKVAFLDGVKKAGGVEVEKGGIKIQRPSQFRNTAP
jgi:hypothetical protein